MAASGPDAIQVAAKYTNGLISTSKPDNAKETFDIFDKAAAEKGKDPTILEKIAKPKISYSEDYDEAVRSCEFWRASLIENIFDLDISDPIKLQEKAKQEISDDKLKQSILIVTKIDNLIKPIEGYFKSGFTQVFTHGTSPNEKEFIQKFTKGVLPYFMDNLTTRDRIERTLIIIIHTWHMFYNIVICVLLHRKGEISHLSEQTKYLNHPDLRSTLS
jgi:alkanesulfonate monooxygenase SsuD/methylene tetrahydromethanopterin reductase-like flavin-dependent oxidoreductase (luciferase family)